MNYYICKLEFITPYRFGKSSSGAELAQTDIICHADTLFSALVDEAISFGGQDKFNGLLKACSERNLLFSDMYPYDNDELLLPKPLLPIACDEKTTVSSLENHIKKYKTLKKRNYIKISEFTAYLSNIRNVGELYVPNSINNILKKQLIERVNCRGEENLPYFVEQVVFSKNCGLYFIMAIKNKEIYSKINELIELLSYSGIGGKRSSGYGKFKYKLIPLRKINQQTSMDILYTLLTSNDDNCYMALSTIVPQKEEVSLIKKGFYQLLPRSGFVTDAAYSDTPLKRNRYFAIAAGSCFSKPIIGSIIDVNNKGKHPVYRYGKGIYVGLTV